MQRIAMQAFRLVGLVAVLAVVLAAPAYGANSQTFQDAVGDNGGAGTPDYAVDIVSVQVSSADDGRITFTVTLRTQDAEGGQLFDDDFVSVDIDADRDSSTGENGFEASFFASGSPPALICNVTAANPNSQSCEALAAENVSRVVSPPNTHILSFTAFQSNWFLIRFRVMTSFGTNVDLAPNSTLFEYDVRADPDGDGFSGVGDACPNRKAGNYDRNGDGCPGPYLKVPFADVGIRAVASSSSIRYVSFRVKNAPANSTVKVRAGNRTFTRRGPGAISGMVGRVLSVGQTITITISKPGWCTSVVVLRVRAGGHATVSRRTVNPGGGIQCVGAAGRAAR